MGLGIGVGFRGLMNPLEDKLSYTWAKVIPRTENSQRAFFVNFGYAKVSWGIMALTFMGLGALEVVIPPPYAFLIKGLLSPFSNCPLLMASYIPVPQSHNSPKELIGNDKSLLLYAGRKFLIIMLI